jgi:hypothetical protein
VTDWCDIIIIFNTYRKNCSLNGFENIWKIYLKEANVSNLCKTKFDKPKISFSSHFQKIIIKIYFWINQPFCQNIFLKNIYLWSNDT